MFTATTKHSFEQNFKTWDSIGFLSRMIKVSYTYKKDTENKILNFLNDSENKLINELIKGYRVTKIKSDKLLNSQFNKLVEGDFRKLLQLQTLAKCNSLLNNRKEVIQDDINEVLRLSKFMNFDFNSI